MTHTFDLNNPSDCRQYLRIFENEGLLTFEDDQDSVESLDDDSVLDVAKQIFDQSHPDRTKFIQ